MLANSCQVDVMRFIQAILLSIAYFITLVLISMPFLFLWIRHAKTVHPEIVGGPIEQLPIEIISAVAAFVAVWLFGLKFKSVRLHDLGLGHRQGMLFAIVGAAIGICLVAGTLGTLYSLGILTFNPDYRFEFSFEFVALAAGVVANVFAQQIIFFGYILTVVRKKTSSIVALPTVALLFLGAHAGVFTQTWPVSAIGAANLFLAGLMLSLAHLRSKTLWMGIGLHSGWNLSQALSGLAVTGQSIGVGAPPFILEGPAALTGGSIGIEASLISIPYVLAGILIVALMFRAKQTDAKAVAAHGP